MVAWMTLCGFDVPMHLVRMSCTPATSSTGRTAPPAMTPVPALAGRRTTAPAPKCPCTSCGIVPPWQRDAEQVLLRLLGPLADRLRDLVGLAEAGADVAALIADDDERRERESPAALDDLGDAIDEHDAVDELADVFVVDSHLAVLFPSRTSARLRARRRRAPRHDRGTCSRHGRTRPCRFPSPGTSWRCSRPRSWRAPSCRPRP